MRFACESCQTRYNLADEKIRGRILKIRCKSCNHVMVVRDPALVVQEAAPSFEDAPTRNISVDEAMRLAAAAARPAEDSTRVISSSEVEKLVRSTAAVTPGPAMPVAPVVTPGPVATMTPGPGTAAVSAAMAASVDRAAELRNAMSRKPAVAAAPAGAAPADGLAEEWWAMSGGVQVGPMSRTELRRMVADGEITLRNYVWREGMENWQRFESVAELQVAETAEVPAADETPASPVAAPVAAMVAPVPDPAAFLDPGFSAEARLADAIAEEAWVEKPVAAERPAAVTERAPGKKAEAAPKKRTGTLRLVQLAGAGVVLAGAFAAGAFFFLPAGEGGKAPSADGSPLVTGPVRLADFELPEEAPLDRTAVGEALATRLDGFARCVQDHAPKGARPRRVVMRAVIAPAGNVTNAQVTAGSAEGDFAACLADRARDIKFPSFTGEPVELSFPLSITED